MKNRLLCFVTSLIVIISLLPICVSAAGGYYVIKGERTYHNVFCKEVTGYYIEDLKWYPTLAKVKSAGFKPGTCCEDSGIDYEQDGATAWFSKDQKTQNAMELERFMGILDSVELIEEENDASYDSGYETGYETGYDDGYAEAMNELEEKYKKKNKTTNILLIVVAIFFGLPAISTIIEIFLNIVDSFKKKS